MADLTEQEIADLRADIARVNTAVNSLGTYTTDAGSGSLSVSTLRQLIADVTPIIENTYETELDGRNDVDLSNGKYFYALSIEEDEGIICYKKVDSVTPSIEQFRLPTSSAVRAAVNSHELLIEEYTPNPFLVGPFSINASIEGTAEIEYTTTENTGTVYISVYLKDSPEPSWTQIKNGKDGQNIDGIYFISVDVFSLNSAFDFLPTVDSGVVYTAYIFHQREDGAASRRLSTDFFFPVILFSGAIDGTAGSIVQNAGTSVVSENSSDSEGGAEGVNITDVNDSGSGVSFDLFNSVIPDRVITIETKVKKNSGLYNELRFRLGNFPESYLVLINIDTGTVLQNDFNNLTVEALDNSWFSLSFSFDATGWTDLSGRFYCEFMLSNSPVIARDGTNSLNIHDMRIY